jgi:hypothetical protein
MASKFEDYSSELLGDLNLHCSEVREEKNVWDERARTIQDDVELRRSLKKPEQLNKSRVYVYKLFLKSGKNNLLLDVGCETDYSQFPWRISSILLLASTFQKQ